MGVYAGPTETFIENFPAKWYGSTSISGGIVTDGLVLALDAGVSRSYPGSGAAWTDLSGLGNNGTLVNGVGYNSSNGGALSFDGGDDYVTLTNTSNLRPETKNFTMSAWFNINDSAGGNAVGNATLLGTEWSGGSPIGKWIIYTYPDGSNYRVSFLIWDSILGGGNSIFTSNSIQNNTWYNIHITRNGNSFSFYINSTLQSTSTNTASMSNTTSLIYIGRYFDPNGFNGFFNGKISNISFYENRALTAQEIQQNFNATRSRFGI